MYKLLCRHCIDRCMYIKVSVHLNLRPTLYMDNTPFHTQT